MSLEKEPSKLHDSKKSWYIRHNLWLAFVLLFVIASVASIVTLGVLGLMTSIWLVVPCVFLFMAILGGIKLFYGERQPNVLTDQPVSTNVYPTKPSNLQQVQPQPRNSNCDGAYWNC